MATFNRYEIFSEDLCGGVHDFVGGTDAVFVALSNTAQSASLDAVLADVGEIAAGNGYTAGGADTQNTFSRTGAVSSVVGTDVTFTASGGAIAQFQYVVAYNSTTAAKTDPLINWWDNGSAVDLATGESFTVDFGTEMFTVG